MHDPIANVYCPDQAAPPGETLREVLEHRQIPLADLAERMERPQEAIAEIIHGEAPITPETALQLEHVLGIPATFWGNLERNYRESIARAEASRLRVMQGLSPPLQPRLP